MKSALFSFLSLVSKGVSLPTLLSFLPQGAILPFYHAVSDRELPHIKHLYQAKNTLQFRKDLDFLLNNFEVVDVETFLNYQQGHSKLSKPYCLLSFDDGLREFQDVIAPILLEKGVPAICFINSDFVDNKSLFYRYKASLLIERYLSSNSSTKHMFQAWLEKKRANSNVIQSVLAVSYPERFFLEEAAEILEVNYSHYLEREKPYLSTEQIKTLSDRGFYFGSHSIDHPYFYQISLKEQLKQAIESSLWVKNNFSFNSTLFAFPFTDHAVSKKFFTNLEASGMVDYTFGTAGIKKDAQKNHWQRLAFEQFGMSGEDIVRAEMLSYLLKVPFGKHLIKRK